MAGDSEMNAPLAALRASVIAARPLGDGRLAPGIDLRIDPAAQVAGHWSSPRGRLLELQTEVAVSGDWIGLHLALPPLDLTGVAWLGLALRSAGGSALVVRACLRSGLAGGGFRDDFLDRHILSQPGETDHVDMLAPDRRPGLPLRAPWREVVLFLPPAHSVTWALHDLRLFRL
jgi:hypothetical protein